MVQLLDAPFNFDGKATTLRQLFKRFLSTLFKESEGFSGKRPFGNSSWEHDIAAGLIGAGLLEGELDEDGYADFEWADFNSVVSEAISQL